METETERALRAAWNNYVFARAGLAPGAGMQLVSESDAFDKLSDAYHALTAKWDER